LSLSLCTGEYKVINITHSHIGLIFFFLLSQCVFIERDSLLEFEKSTIKFFLKLVLDGLFYISELFLKFSPHFLAVS